MSASCQAKEHYPTDLAAKAAALRALDRQQGRVRVLYAYNCPKCGGWHVGRRWRAGAVEFRYAKDDYKAIPLVMAGRSVPWGESC